MKYIPAQDTTSQSALLMGISVLTFGLLFASVLLIKTSGEVAHAQTASSTMATSTGSNASSTTEPVISMLAATPNSSGAMITWATDEPSNSEVMYGTTSGYGSSTTLDTADVTNHSEMIYGLMPDTTYYYGVQDMDASGNTNILGDMTFMTLAASTSSSTTSTGSTASSTGSSGWGWTASSTDTGGYIETALTQLQAEIATLMQEVQAILTHDSSTISSGSTSGSGTTGTASSTSGTSTGTTTLTSAAMIDQNGESVHAGSTLDFSGRNFGHEEQVTVTMDGQTVATAHADGGGNFSTGSFAAPLTAGTYTYTFTGQTSGMTATATVTVT